LEEGIPALTNAVLQFCVRSRNATFKSAPGAAARSVDGRSAGFPPALPLRGAAIGPIALFMSVPPDILDAGPNVEGSTTIENC
jgi:hypothetical protein